jgi:hypothetical protein
LSRSQVAAQEAAAASVAAKEAAAAAASAAAEEAKAQLKEGQVLIKGTVVDLSEKQVNKLADKSVRKAKRRLRRKLALNRYVSSVVAANTAEELYDCVVALENMIPSAFVLVCENKKQLPNRGSSGARRAVTTSTVALRLYALDRSLCYDELKGAELAAAGCAHKLRYIYTPKCMQTPNCTRELCHSGKCSQITEQASRMIEPVDRVIGSYGSSTTAQAIAAMQARAAAQRAAGGAYGGYGGYGVGFGRFRQDDEPLSKYLKTAESVPRMLDVELINPYLPPMNEITKIETL